MAVNRIRRENNRLEQAGFFPTLAPMSQPMAAPQPVPMLGMMMMVPMQMNAVAWQQQVYQMAYARARATTLVPRHYRRFFSNWN